MRIASKISADKLNFALLIVTVGMLIHRRYNCGDMNDSFTWTARSLSHAFTLATLATYTVSTIATATYQAVTTVTTAT